MAKLPAFGKELLALREQGKRPAHVVLLTDSWAAATFWRGCADAYALVCDDPRARYSLSCVAGCDVVVSMLDERRTPDLLAQVQQNLGRAAVVSIDELIALWRGWVESLHDANRAD